MPLFPQILNLPECFSYHENCISVHKSRSLYQYLVDNLKWQQPEMSMFGKVVRIPRKQVYMAEPRFAYAYSGLTMTPAPWVPVLMNIRNTLNKRCNVTFNAVLINWYQDGNDSVSWHADDEVELGTRPVIASISLGETRKMKIRHKISKDVFDIMLEDGSCLIMQGESQSVYEHCIPKIAGKVAGRINLTFRTINN